MRVEVVSNDEFFVFVNSLYGKIKNYNDKDEIVSVVKDIILKVKNRLRLRGFYKLKVFVNSKVGLFIEGIKLESIDRVSGLDLRVVVYFDEDIYFKTEDYFVISDVPNVRYWNNNYYCLVDDISDITKVVDFGEFVYGSSLEEMFDNSCLI